MHVAKTKLWARADICRGLLTLLCIYGVTEVAGTKACYLAKTCIHNNHEKCGVDGNGKPRRFIDSCDLLEFNCLKNTDFAKAAATKCDGLPPIPPESEDKKLRGKEADSGGESEPRSS